MTDAIHLRAGDAAASVALRGAEPLTWRVGGRDLLWHGDPAHWSYRAPILFPVVGASLGGAVTVDGQAYPMAQHGFARVADFALVGQDEGSAHLRLVDGAATQAHYPFAFRLDVHVSLEPDALMLRFEVANTGDRPMPYGLGFHPAFPWPLGGAPREAHRVVFADAERDAVPEVAPGGLLARTTRPAGLAEGGRTLPLDPTIFTEALVFLDARSRAMRFIAPSGAAIGMETEGFPHLAVWSRPDAPFLSLECWTAHADWADASGELHERASMALLQPGGAETRTVRLTWSEPAS